MVIIDQAQKQGPDNGNHMSCVDDAHLVALRGPVLTDPHPACLAYRYYSKAPQLQRAGHTRRAQQAANGEVDGVSCFEFMLKF